MSDRDQEGIIWHVAPEDAGQMVEVAYGSDCAGTYYRRTVDRSDGSTYYARADSSECGCSSECDCWQPWNRAPSAFVWVSCAAPEVGR